ncbi:hypothetical protein [Nocardia sp. XZ_19_231]|uniref:hypothetical protein n=1 Tax=Nocardia sp. XZ_19_231 TaxID=2769252 RepID=UPI00188FDED6|nr:hypothetical protein [Nocardia sp. XZ_19_231]
MTTAHPEYDIDPEIRAEVSRIRREWIGMDPQQTPVERERQIDEESAHLTALVAEITDQSAHGFLVDQWRADHPGSDPDQTTVLALMTTAQRSARQQVLEEHLYSQLTPEILEQRRSETAELVGAVAAEIESARTAADPDRWRRRMVQPTELAEQIVTAAWGLSRSMDFTILALALIQQRLDDNAPTPISSVDPLVDDLTDLIEAQLDQEAEPSTPTPTS